MWTSSNERCKNNRSDWNENLDHWTSVASAADGRDIGSIGERRDRDCRKSTAFRGDRWRH
jgi:hypothetical protein